MRSFLLAPLLLALLAPAGAAEPDLDYAKTHVVIVGILNWKDPSITSFAAKDRKDRELLETLVARGVPRSQTRLLLDDDATLANIEATLAETASRVPKDGTLIVYYAGHGSIVEEEIYFLNYDYVGAKAAVTGLSVTRLSRLLSGKLRGGRLLLFADCCHSGGMARVAESVAKGPAGAKAASLTSAEDSNISTGNWTFTLTLLDGLRGEGVADDDGNGAVTLGELATEVRDAMKFREMQRHGFALHGVSPGLGLARTDGDHVLRRSVGAFEVKQYATVALEKGVRVGRVVGSREGRIGVQLQGYSDREIKWVEPARLNTVKFDLYEPGTSIEVLWGKRIWDAKVLRRDGDFHWITYPGWPHVWDEWVLSNRISPVGGFPVKKALEKARCGGRYDKLLKKIGVKQDVAKYGLFHEEGYYDLDEWGGHKDLPAGFWVYVYPHWYIFETRK